MRKKGFEPSQALSHLVLNQVHLTTLTLPLKIRINYVYKKFYKPENFKNIEDGHSKLETSVPIRTQKLSFLRRLC